MKKQKHPFSLAIRITEELKNETDYKLYDEMQVVNNLIIVGDIDTTLDLDLDA